jgi:hypothetical protein
LLLFIGLIVLASANKLAAKYLVDRASKRCVLYSKYFYRFLALATAVLLCLRFSVYSYWLFIILVRCRHAVISAIIVNIV